jgi:hypothetical protein
VHAFARGVCYVSGSTVCQVCYRPTGDAAFLCPTDQELFETKLRDMAGAEKDDLGHRQHGLFWDLDATIARQMGNGEAYRRYVAGSGDPLPYDADRDGRPVASRLAQELLTCLITTAREYGADDLPGQREQLLRTLVEQGATVRMRKDRRRELDILRDQVRAIDADLKLLATREGVAEWILGRLYLIRLSETAGDTFREIVRRYEAARRCADRSSPEKTYLADCATPAGSDDTCRTPLRMPIKSDATTVRCPRCRAEYNVSDLIAARDAAVDSGLATMREIADAGYRLPWSNRVLTIKMIEGYERRGKIAARGHRFVENLGRKVATYRIGEVKAAAYDADRPRTA